MGASGNTLKVGEQSNANEVAPVCAFNSQTVDECALARTLRNSEEMQGFHTGTNNFVYGKTYLRYKSSE